jgi:hypothetical protein
MRVLFALNRARGEAPDKPRTPHTDNNKTGEKSPDTHPVRLLWFSCLDSHMVLYCLQYINGQRVASSVCRFLGFVKVLRVVE